MNKVIELEGRAVTITFKQIEINGKDVLAPAVVAVSMLPDNGQPVSLASAQGSDSVAAQAETE